MKTCLFCKIINKEIPAEIVYEDDKVMAFKDINPLAPFHLLIVPKRHIQWEDQFKEKDLLLFSHLIFVAKKIAVKQKINKAYKLVFNIGKTADINHIHLHLLGGWKKYS